MALAIISTMSKIMFSFRNIYTQENEEMHVWPCRVSSYKIQNPFFLHPDSKTDDLDIYKI